MEIAIHVSPYMSAFGAMRLVEDAILAHRVTVPAHGHPAPIYCAQAFGYAARVGYGGTLADVVRVAWANHGIRVIVGPRP